MILLSVVLFFASLNQAHATDDKTILKQVWKIEQIYFDQIPASVDSLLVNFRMIPASDSLFYLHDGKSPKLMYWNLEGDGQKMTVYQERDLIGITPFIEYHIHYADEQNLILTLDVSAKNIGVALIEYRLVPDLDFFNP